jgi:hypothetical protein
MLLYLYKVRQGAAPRNGVNMIVKAKKFCKVRKDGSVKLCNWEATPENVKPGDEIEVTLWRHTPWEGQVYLRVNEKDYPAIALGFVTKGF